MSKLLKKFNIKGQGNFSAEDYTSGVLLKLAVYLSKAKPKHKLKALGAILILSIEGLSEYHVEVTDDMVTPQTSDTDINDVVNIIEILTKVLKLSTFTDDIHMDYIPHLISIVECTSFEIHQYGGSVDYYIAQAIKRRKTKR